MTTSIEPFDDYQIEGAQWLATKTHALLADDMGLGKTAQAIRALDAIGAQNVLCLCPAVARIHWTRELQRYSSRSWTSTALLSTANVKTLPPSGFVSCSYDLTTNKEVMAALSRRQWDVCLLDEAHYLRRTTAARTRHAFHLATKAKRSWAITGTPIVRDASDLFPLLAFFGEWKGSYWQFAHHFCVVRETPFGLKIEPGVKREDELGRMLSRIMLRRTKDQLAVNLPPLMYDRVTIQPSKVEKKVWECYFPGHIFSPEKLQREVADGESAIRKLLDSVATGHEAMRVLTALSEAGGEIKSLRQWIALQKAPAIIEMVKAELEANAYDKVIIFAVHRAMIEELRLGLDEYRPRVIYGGTTPEARIKAVDKFQTQKPFRVFIGQITAAGTAIDLTAANQVIMAESDWLPANNAQAIMRAHRRSQKRPVTVRWVEMEGSVDAKIQELCRARTKAMTTVFAAARENEIDIFAA